MASVQQITQEEIFKILSRMNELIYHPKSTEVVNEIQGKDIVIFLGNTRSGKSVVVNYLIGNQLKAIKVRRNTYGLVAADSVCLGPEIGIESTSKTAIPTKWNSERIGGFLVDPPGFDDNRGVAQDVANAFYIKELIRNANSVKFVLISDINDIFNDNIKGFLDFIDKIYTILPQSESLVNGMVFVFTKDKDDSTVNDICNELRRKILEQSQIQIRNRKFVEIFAQSPERIVIFKMPEREGNVDFDSNIFGNMIHVIENVSNALSNASLSKVTPGISDKSRVFLLEAHTHFTELKEFVGVLDEVLKQFTFKLQKIAAVDQNATADQIKIVKEELKKLKDKLDTLINSKAEVENQLKSLYEIVPEVVALKPGSDIYTKLQFTVFVDFVLQMKKSAAFTLKINYILSQMKDKILGYYVQAQEKTLEITVAESKKQLDEIEKKRLEDKKEFETKIEKLNEENKKLVEEQKKLAKQLEEAKKKDKPSGNFSFSLGIPSFGQREQPQYQQPSGFQLPFCLPPSNNQWC